MFKVRHKARRAAWVAAIACGLLAQMTFAQATTAQDPFVAMHANLVGAADRVLADALADRPWMKAAVANTDAEQPTTADRMKRFGAAVDRVQGLRPVVEPIFRTEGVPPEMIAVALVESGGQSRALSPKGARGVWQFMPDTARRYGLAVSDVRDERVDLVKSTRAAARYLHDLRQQFGDWRLAFAAYNAGEQAVQNAINRSGHRAYSAIQGFLPSETRSYVPAVEDAMRLFGGSPDPQQHQRTEPHRASMLYAPGQFSE